MEFDKKCTHLAKYAIVIYVATNVPIHYITKQGWWSARCSLQQTLICPLCLFIQQMNFEAAMWFSYNLDMTFKGGTLEEMATFENNGL